MLGSQNSTFPFNFSNQNLEWISYLPIIKSNSCPGYLIPCTFITLIYGGVKRYNSWVKNGNIHVCSFFKVGRHFYNHTKQQVILQLLCANFTFLGRRKEEGEIDRLLQRSPPHLDPSSPFYHWRTKQMRFSKRREKIERKWTMSKTLYKRSRKPVCSSCRP